MSDFVSGRGFAPQDRSGPSQAEIARLEYEASLKQDTNGTKATKGRKYVPAPDLGWFHGWNEYDTGQRMTRIHKTVKRIRDDMKRLQDWFDSLSEPNRADRRIYVAILKRMRHAIDTMPNQ